MKRVVFVEECKDLADWLNYAKVFYLATADKDGTPHVRPFGAAVRHDGGVWFCTRKEEIVHEQPVKKAKVELVAMLPNVGGPCWISARGTIALEDNVGARDAMIEYHPEFRVIHADKLQMLHFVGEANLLDTGGQMIRELKV